MAHHGTSSFATPSYSLDTSSTATQGEKPTPAFGCLMASWRGSCMWLTFKSRDEKTSLSRGFTAQSYGRTEIAAPSRMR